MQLEKRNASISEPEGDGAGETLVICGAFDFSEEFLVKFPPVGSQNLVKSDQYLPPSNTLFSDEKRVGINNNPLNPHNVRCYINLPVY